MKISKKKCVGLVEVSIAILILAIVLGGFFNITWYSLSQVRESWERTAAYNLARESLEEFSDWARISGLSAGLYSLGTTTINGVSYSRVLNIVNITPQLKQITLTVSWTGDNPIQVSTLKTNY